LARVIASRPELAFLDEPTSAMDQLAEASAYAGLDALRRSQNVAVILVTHDLTLARSRADRVLFLDDVERRVHVGSAEEVFSTPALRKRYGFAFDGVDGA
jgi:ABC-type Mn2+/Zn2+ transport system ATPase subunit